MLGTIISSLGLAAQSGAGADAGAGALIAIMGLYVGMMGVFALVYCAIFIFAIIAFVIWIWALIDCISRKDYPGENDRLLWALVILLGGILGAIIYYFVVKRKNAPKDASASKPQ